MFSKAAEKLSEYAKKFNMTPLEKKLHEAMSNENWGAPNSLLIELAQATSSFNDFYIITRELWLAIEEKPERWRRILKALVLLDFLLKYGTDRMAEETRQKLPRIRSLMEFRFSEDGRERGGGIREKAAYLMNMINDEAFMASERIKSKAGKERFVGVASSGAVHSFNGYSTASAPSPESINPNAQVGDGFAAPEVVSTERLEKLRKQPERQPKETIDLLDFDSPKNNGADFDDFGDFVSSRPTQRSQPEHPTQQPNDNNPFDLMSLNSPKLTPQKEADNNPFSFSGL